MPYTQEEMKYVFSFNKHLRQWMVEEYNVRCLIMILCESGERAFRAGWEAGTGQPAPAPLTPSECRPYEDWMDVCVNQLIRELYRDLGGRP